MFAKELQNEMRTRREKMKNINYQIDPTKKKDAGKEKKITIPDYHFYDNRDILQEILQKED